MPTSLEPMKWWLLVGLLGAGCGGYSQAQLDELRSRLMAPHIHRAPSGEALYSINLPAEPRAFRRGRALVLDIQLKDPSVSVSSSSPVKAGEFETVIFAMPGAYQDQKLVYIDRSRSRYSTRDPALPTPQPSVVWVVGATLTLYSFDRRTGEYLGSTVVKGKPGETVDPRPALEAMPEKR